MFITFEGIECAGKSTLSQKFVKYLKDSGESVTYIREPGTTKVGEELRRILSENSMNTISRAALFSASFFETWNTVIVPAKDRGDIIVSDRWYHSMLAYQTIDGDKVSQNFVRNIHKSLVDIGATPDITILVDISLPTFSERMRRRKNLDVTESLGIEYHRQVKNNYNSLMSTEDNMFWISGEESLDVSVEDVFKIFLRKTTKNIGS